MQSIYVLYHELLENLSVVWKHKKIRVGYISADLRDHAVAQFVRPMLWQYDTEKFAVYVYSLTRHHDRVTEALQQGGTRWRDVSADRWPQIAAQIRFDEIDILVDLAGHSADNALPVFVWRPATIQISGIGYFNSIGTY